MQLNRAVPEQISGSFDVHTGLKPSHGRVMAQRVHAHALDACLVGEPRYHVPSVRKCPLVVVIAGRRLASVAEITVARAGVERLDELVGFWKLLHRHQSSVAPAVPGLDVLSESDSAVIVGKMYREWLSSPDSFAFLAEEDGRLVGYVVGFYDEPHFMWSTSRVGHTHPPTHCPNGHVLGPNQVLVGHQACLGHGGAHTTWTCRVCDETVYGPPLNTHCTTLDGPARVR